MSALIIRDDSNRLASFSETAHALKTDALEKAALVGRVTCAEEQQAAVDAQTAIATVLKETEKARVACKEPVLDFGRRIDATAKTFIADLREEEIRLATLVGDFQQLEAARVRAEQTKENERLRQVERDRQAALSQANSHEEMEAVQERFDRQVAEEARPVIAPARVEGQIVREEWEVTVTDVWALARAHPGCVKIEPRMAEIKAMLDSGQKVAGVLAKKVTKAGVRAMRHPAAIEV